MREMAGEVGDRKIGKRVRWWEGPGVRWRGRGCVCGQCGVCAGRWRWRVVMAGER